MQISRKIQPIMKSQSIEIYPEITAIIQLVNKDIKTITVTTFYTLYQEARKKLTMLEIWGDYIKENTNQTPRIENY